VEASADVQVKYLEVSQHAICLWPTRTVHRYDDYEVNPGCSHGPALGARYISCPSGLPTSSHIYPLTWASQVLYQCCIGACFDSFPLPIHLLPADSIMSSRAAVEIVSKVSQQAPKAEGLVSR
jgi:hypothetical protein